MSTNIWGTDTRLINSEEFCPQCEREVPYHYRTCPLSNKQPPTR